MNNQKNSQKTDILMEDNKMIISNLNDAFYSPKGKLPVRSRKDKSFYSQQQWN